jgi:hypothetical protein
LTRRWAGFLIVFAALVLVVAYFLLRTPAVPRLATLAETTAETAAPAGAPAATPAPPESRRVTLWLPAAGGRIAPLETEVTSAAEPKARIEALLRALLAATPSAPLAPLFDAPVELGAALRGPRATLYVDLVSKEGAPPPGSGSLLELQRVYAIVHTVVRNEQSIERVVLLWNGAQRRSLSGHVDTGHPLVPRPELEARAPGERPEPGAGAPSAPVRAAPDSPPAQDPAR